MAGVMVESRSTLTLRWNLVLLFVAGHNRIDYQLEVPGIVLLVSLLSTAGPCGAAPHINFRLIMNSGALRFSLEA
jgi:hypothetical protein